MKEKYISNFLIALEAVLANKVRSILTGLGIIFGVAAVIAMLAIGSGAQQEILDQIKLVGVNNIIITPISEQKEGKLSENDEPSSTKKEKDKFTPGLTFKDAESIRDIIPGVRSVSPEIMLETTLIKDGISRTAKLVGVEPNYFEITNFSIFKGRHFNQEQMKRGDPVCIIGKGIQTRFFSKEDPIGKMIKVGPHWLKIVGVLDERIINKSSIANLGIRNYNMDVYAPIKTVLVRYKNRALVTEAMIQAHSRGGRRGNGSGPKSENYHQLDRLVIQVEETEKLTATADVLARLMERRHHGVIDYEVSIPELLLKQQQRTKGIFNIVLGAIAGISLLVGGIGIMNIMLASVLERIKEIGLRMALGAQKQDIVLQFLFEAMMISISGGLIGIVLGVSFARVISGIAEIPTIISASSIVISFGVAATVGLIFGIMPAKRAAQQDPITSLRYE